jgi:hypothetical protein
MAKISELPALEVPLGTETVVVESNGQTHRVAYSALVDAAVAPALIGSGDLMDAVSIIRPLANGAVSSGDAGIAIPAGSSGQGAALITSLPFDATAQVGRTLRFRAIYDQSAVFTRTVLPAVNVVTASATEVRAGTYATAVIGGRRVVTFEYVVRGDELQLQPHVAIGEGSVAASAESITQAGLSMYYQSAMNPALTASDEALAARLPGEITRIGDPAYRLSLGEQIADVSSARQYFNGAVASGEMGITIPAGAKGTNTVLQVIWRYAGARNVGRRIHLVSTFSQTGPARTWSTGLQVSTLAGLASREPVATKLTRAGNIRTVVQEYLVQGDELDLRPFRQNGDTDAAAADTSLVLTSFIPSHVTAMDPKLSVLEETLAERLPNDIARVADPLYRLSSGNLLPLIDVSLQAFNGATAVGKAGFAIASRANGQNSIIQPSWPIASEARAGQTVRLVLAFTQSATFTRTMAIAMQAGTAEGTINPAATITTKVVGNRRIVTIDYVLRGDEVKLMPYVQLNTATAVAQLETLALTDFVGTFSGSASDTLTVADEAVATAVSAAMLTTSDRPIVTIRQTGGDFASIPAALAAINDASPRKRYRFRIKPRDDGAQWALPGEVIWKNWIDLEGDGPDHVGITYYQPDNADPALIGRDSAFRVHHDAAFRALGIRVKNSRYVFHIDSPEQSGRMIEFEDVIIEHLSNDGARAYRQANGLDPNVIWASLCAIGMGTWSEAVTRVRGSLIRSPNAPFLVHNAPAPQALPSLVDIESSTIEATQSANKIAVQILSQGSRQRDIFRLVGDRLIGSVSSTIPSSSSALGPEWQIIGHGNKDLTIEGEAVRHLISDYLA